MDEESQKLLQDTFALVKDNNKMLHRIRRSQKISSFIGFVYWLIIIGVALGSFYLIQPYVDKVVSVYNSIANANSKLNGVSGNTNIQDLLKKFTN